MASIREFYRNKVIFITGGTGFVGKVLIEKLLRSCDGIGTIYLLLRERKGQSPEKRLEEFKNDDVFERIREKCPDRFKVLVALFGEISQDQLGLSEESLRQLHEVNIIFHCAASVRFDEPIRRALLKNTKGTYETLEIACRLPFLESFVHVSTTYCVGEDNLVVEEKIYPPKYDWKRALKAIELFSEEELDPIAYKLTDMPNTYVFTKSLSENMVDSYKKLLPLVIFRPSIIFSAENEPMPGYIANFNGPVGLLLATACGIMRTLWLPKPTKMCMVPIDTCTNGIVVAAYARKTAKENELPVYNASTKLMGIIDIIKIGKKNVIEHSPPEYLMWRPGGWITDKLPEFYLRFIFTMIIPAIIVDNILRAINKKPILMKIQRYIWYGGCALRYYMDTEFKIRNEQFLGLMKKIPIHEVEEFRFDERYKNMVEYMKVSQAGARKFLLKQDISTLERSKENIKKLILADRIIKYFIFGVIFWFVYKKFIS